MKKTLTVLGFLLFTTNVWAYTFTCITSQENLNGLAFEVFQGGRGESSLDIHEVNFSNGQLISDLGNIKQSNRVTETAVNHQFIFEADDVSFALNYLAVTGQPTIGRITKLPSTISTSTTRLNCFIGTLRDLIP
ncbi:hypothetical protein SHI21_04015 [Bacteriovorax sp. PP10]|uniref:Uncharacterized protein n=1 Tax=Bacteriovorax antarcticus TaxID=3088717 RepID=A0ABU5VSM5_9BACT|nr:hypothetical protein [Bacteriovorax sp. PP10]MEA9355349.1 hypothetical protein [Bacteriovorax sp. PP10]